jgi:hypothetical protein
MMSGLTRCGDGAALRPRANYCRRGRELGQDFRGRWLIGLG